MQTVTKEILTNSSQLCSSGQSVKAKKHTCSEHILVNKLGRAERNPEK